MNKLYITGPVGSGKSTLARRIANEYGHTCCELDSVVYERDPNTSDGNRKRAPEVQNQLFQSVLSQPKWVMEDAGRVCFEECLKQADTIILLEPSPFVRRFRIVSRWIKQNLNLEYSGYTPSLGMLKAMFKWSKSYEIGVDTLKQRLIPYNDKVSVLRNNREIKRFLKNSMNLKVNQ